MMRFCRDLLTSSPAVIVLLLVVLAGCSDFGDRGFRIKRETGEQSVPEDKAAGAEAQAENQPEEPPDPFVLYYTIDPVPEKLLKGWKSETQVDWPVEQRALPGDMSELPVDGDFYVVTPQWVPLLQASLDLEDFQSNPILERINPTFSGFSFDPENRVCLPWRWTPYGYVVSQTEPGFQPGEWKQADGYAWPEDPVLRAAVWRKNQGLSANSFQRAAPAPGEEENYESWEAIRERWAAGTYRVIYVPVAWWLQREPEEEPEDAPGEAVRRLLLPGSGSLLHFEHVAVPSERERVTVARALAAYLLSERAQKWLLPYTGYFPVTSQMSREMEGADLPVDRSAWLDLCEFALAPPAYREVRPPPDPEGPDAEDEPPMEEVEDESDPQPELAPIVTPLDQIPLDPPLGL
jgi:hypothetical protein